MVVILASQPELWGGQQLYFFVIYWVEMEGVMVSTFF